MEEDDGLIGSLIVYLWKNLPTCLISPTEGQEMQKKKKTLPEEAIALETYHSVYCNNYIAFRKFSNKQITQIYKLLLSKGNKYVKSPKAWQTALMLEADREERFVMNAMTDITREKFITLMNMLKIPIRQWYIPLDSLLALYKYIKILPDGNIELVIPEDFLIDENEL